VVWRSSKVITEACRKAHERLDNPPWLYIVLDLNPPRDESEGQGFVSPQSWFVDLTLISVQ
jgi:peptide/nickel transport system substrate-binding protein